MAIRDYSQTASLNTAISGISLAEGAMTVASVNDAFRQALADIRELQARASIASAGTMAIGAANAESLDVSGTTTITAFDSVAAGVLRELVFTTALTLTHNATSLILPGGANITTAAGDVALMRSLGSGNWRCASYAKASGVAVSTSGVSAASETVSGIAELATQAETDGGTDDERIVTALKLATYQPATVTVDTVNDKLYIWDATTSRVRLIAFPTIPPAQTLATAGSGASAIKTGSGASLELRGFKVTVTNATSGSGVSLDNVDLASSWTGSGDDITLSLTITRYRSSGGVGVGGL